jgi:hypothetical protein
MRPLYKVVVVYKVVVMDCIRSRFKDPARHMSSHSPPGPVRGPNTIGLRRKTMK